jgi:hypothetical protein
MFIRLRACPPANSGPELAQQKMHDQKMVDKVPRLSMLWRLIFAGTATYASLGSYD